MGFVTYCLKGRGDRQFYLIVQTRSAHRSFSTLSEPSAYGL